MQARIATASAFGHDPKIWEAAKSEVLKELRAVAAARKLISYGELASRVSAIAFSPHEATFHHLLGQLSVESDAAGGGMISALVVHRDGDQLPGPGYFKLAARLGRDTTDRLKCWTDEVSRIHAIASKK